MYSGEDYFTVPSGVFYGPVLFWVILRSRGLNYGPVIFGFFYGPVGYFTVPYLFFFEINMGLPYIKKNIFFSFFDSLWQEDHF